MAGVINFQTAPNHMRCSRSASGPAAFRRACQPFGRLSVRLALGLCLLMLALAACTDSADPPPARPVAEPEYSGTIVAMGDSLTEGYGLDPQQAYPALLETLLQENGHRYRVVNAGISGETSSGAASRIEWILKLDPDIVIIETGANDAFRGVEAGIIQSNIADIIQALQTRNIVVVLAGMKMVTNLGREYTAAFERLYHRLAESHDVIFMPFFLQDVAGVSNLNLSDGIHPNARGYAIIAQNLLPHVLRAIERHREMKTP